MTSGNDRLGRTDPDASAPDLILHGGRVWTVDDDLPGAQAVAIAAGRIQEVGPDEMIRSLAGSKTEVIGLEGRTVLPGFVDAHTHFENAVKGYFELRLNGIDTESDLLERLRAKTLQVPDRFWITGGDWSAKAARGKSRHPGFFPNLEAVDRIAPNQPVLLRRHDGAYFINSHGMRLFHISDSTPDPPGGTYGRDANGTLTGALLGSAGPRAEKMLPPPSRARTMVGARAMVSELNRCGIVGIHDIARVPSISERQTFPTNVERSASDVTIFEDLRAEESLHMRVDPILTLRTWQELAVQGISPGSGDHMIRFGTLKMFVGGFLMFRDFPDNPGYSGSLSFRNQDERQLRSEVIAADAAGWDVAAHVTGDRGHALVVESLEAAVARNAPRKRRHRILHAWYPRREEIARAGAMGVFGDITPYHLIREAPSMHSRLHPDQLATAFAWREMIDAGWRIDLVSDWPGSFDGDHPAPLHPLHNMYMAVTRHAVGGSEEEAFHPEQALTVGEAIAAYTINPAAVSGRAQTRGSITPGKFADLVVISDDIRTGEPSRLLEAEVEMTIVGGMVVHQL